MLLQHHHTTAAINIEKSLVHICSTPFYGHLMPIRAIDRETMREFGTKPALFLMDALYMCSDRFLQVCIPSVEYWRSDAPPMLHVAGGLFKDQHDPFKNLHLGGRRSLKTPPRNRCSVIRVRGSEI